MGLEVGVRSQVKLAELGWEASNVRCQETGPARQWGGDELFEEATE